MLYNNNKIQINHFHKQERLQAFFSILSIKNIHEHPLFFLFQSNPPIELTNHQDRELWFLLFKDYFKISFSILYTN